VENVKMGAKEFYNLPIEEKRKFSQKEGDVEGVWSGLCNV
jgi:isopenicillin N synthase-like dioxygenase